MLEGRAEKGNNNVDVGLLVERSCIEWSYCTNTVAALIINGAMLDGVDCGPSTSKVETYLLVICTY